MVICLPILGLNGLMMALYLKANIFVNVINVLHFRFGFKQEVRDAILIKRREILQKRSGAGVKIFAIYKKEGNLGFSASVRRRSGTVTSVVVDKVFCLLKHYCLFCAMRAYLLSRDSLLSNLLCSRDTQVIWSLMVAITTLTTHSLQCQMTSVQWRLARNRTIF